MEMILWKFDDKEVTYRSTPENLERDKVRMALANKLEVDHKIIILNDDRLDSAMPVDSNGNTTCPTVGTLQMDSKKVKPGKKAVQLCNVPGDVDKSDNPTDVDQSFFATGIDSSPSNSISE